MKHQRLPLHNREDFVFERTRGKRVVSIGLGGQVGNTGYSFNLLTADLTKTFSARLVQQAAHVTFLDISDPAIEAFRGVVEADYYNADITADPSTWPDDLAGVQCDVVLLGEVLEHLTDPGAALRSLQTLLAPEGVILVTVPNAFHLSMIVHMARWDERVHPEHVAYYSPSTLARLFDMVGLEVVELGFYRKRPVQLTHLRSSPLGFLSAVASEALPQFGRGLVATARPVQEDRG